MTVFQASNPPLPKWDYNPLESFLGAWGKSVKRVLMYQKRWDTQGKSYKDMNQLLITKKVITSYEHPKRYW